MKSLRTYVENALIKLHTFRLSRKPFINLGNGSYVYWKSDCYGGGKIIIGNNVSIGRASKGPKGFAAPLSFYTTLYSAPKAEIHIGNGTRINGAYIHASSRIDIGDNCVISTGISIMDSNGHETTSNNRTVGADDPKPIVIGDNVWIAINAVILKGSVIGDNSIISAGSVVKGVFPKNSIISGNPAKIVKQLNIQ